MSKILTEGTYVPAVQQQVKISRTCRVAVAYCGAKGASFFPEKAVDWPSDLQILVDASPTAVKRGLTNPNGVEKLLGITSQVRTLAGLHATVFIFDKSAAIVGSVNMSETSITSQFQCALFVEDSRIVSGLHRWFDGLWCDPTSSQITIEAVQHLKGLWQPNPAPHAKIHPHSKWHGAQPDPPLPAVAYDLGVTKNELVTLLKRFKNTPCPYADDGSTCADVAKQNEADQMERSSMLHATVRRMKTWTKADIERIFDLAFTHGKAIQVAKPKFLKHSPGKVGRTVDYLLRGSGDPFLRFQKCLRGGPYHLQGLGPAGLTFLLHLWAPSQFAIVNTPVRKALRVLKVTAMDVVTHSAGAAYRNRTEAIRHISAKLGLGSLARADHFFDAIGKKHITAIK